MGPGGGLAWGAYGACRAGLAAGRCEGGAGLEAGSLRGPRLRLAPGAPVDVRAPWAPFLRRPVPPVSGFLALAFHLL
jgi:hypothetical protein